METDSLNVLTEPLQKLAGDKQYIVGLSGGIDSVLLLNLAALVLVKRNIRVRAIHVHHGLSPNADSWVQFCQTLCSDLNVELIVEYVDLVLGGEGIEAAARHARYQAFVKHLDASNVLLLAQHQDDQLETILMRLLKGSDVRLLSGIPKTRPLGVGALVRPWLGVSRQQIELGAAKLSLNWVEDESNQNLQFTRNKIRHELLPKLEQAYSNLCPPKDYRLELLKLSQYASSMVNIERRAFDAIKPFFVCSGYGGLSALNIDHLKELSSQSVQSVFRLWLGDNKISQPSVKILARVKNELVDAAAGSQSVLHWKGGALMRHGNRAYCFQANPQDHLAQSELDSLLPILDIDSALDEAATIANMDSSAINLPDVIVGRRLQVILMGPQQAKNLAEEHTPVRTSNFVYISDQSEAIQIRQRRPGDVCNGLSLKEYWKQLLLPTLWRESQPVLAIGTELLWAGWDEEKTELDAQRCRDAKSVIWIKSISD